MGVIFGLLTGNFKWIIIGVVAIIIGVGAWKYTALVRDNAIARQTIAQQAQAIAEKDAAIKRERDLNAIQAQILEQQANDLADLNARLEGITEGLPADATDIAPESLRETLRRLRAL